MMVMRWVYIIVSLIIGDDGDDDYTYYVRLIAHRGLRPLGHGMFVTNSVDNSSRKSSRILPTVSDTCRRRSLTKDLKLV
jgi:hypothetical protein